MLDDVEAAREETVQSLLREVGHLGPTLRDARVVRRFAETREWNASETSVLLREYHVFRETHGLEDGSLRRDPEVCREMRRRCTMRLLDPRRAPPPAAATSEAASFASTADPASSSSSQALTFPQLNDSSLWPTARDKDDCPVVYVTMDQFASAHQRRRGRESPSSSVVERTLVAILEQVCEEADAAEAGERSPERPRGGRFTILLDLTRCSRAHVPAFVTFGKILRNALKRGFRGRLNKFYVFPARRRWRVLFEVARPFLGKYTPRKIVMIPDDHEERLGEIFPRECLPVHLGGSSTLLSVAFDERASVSTSVPRGVDGDAGALVSTRGENPAEEPERATRAAASSPNGTDRALSPDRVRVRVPRRVRAFDAAFLALVFLLSREAPGGRETGGGGGASARARDVVWSCARRGVIWRVLGFAGLGVPFAGTWAALVTASVAALGARGRGR